MPLDQALRFRCRLVAPEPQFEGATDVILLAVHGAENAAAWHGTPAGSIFLHLTNQAVFDAFESGAEYDVAFTLVARPLPKHESP